MVAPHTQNRLPLGTKYGVHLHLCGYTDMHLFISGLHMQRPKIFLARFASTLFSSLLVDQRSCDPAVRIPLEDRNLLNFHR